VCPLRPVPLAMKNHLHHRPLALAFTALCVVVSLARTAAAQGADPYESALAASAEAEQRGDLVGAARPLEQVLEVYPQDHALRLRLGWVTFRAGRYADAERAYRAALALAPQSIDARLGLAWTLVREGRCDDARGELSPMLEADDAQAEEIAAACVEPASATGRVSLFAAWNQYFFPGHPYKSSGTGVLAGVRGQTAGGLTLQGAFRHMAFTPTAGSGVSAFTQQEVYGLVGYERPAAALFLQGALVFDGSGVIGTSKHVGLAGRWSPAGDLLLDASLSLYDDQTIARIAPSWSIPVGPLRLVPGVAVQVAGSEVKTTGSFTAALDAGPLSLWAGGKYGEEIRPTYLSQLAVYDILERVRWGAWAGARVRLGSVVSLQATYALDRLRWTDATTGSATESNSHAVTLGPIFTF